MASAYNILEEIACLYCGEEYGTPRALQKHVLREHPDTYAAAAIKEARGE